MEENASMWKELGDIPYPFVLVVDMEQGSKQQLIVIFSAFADRSPGRITLQPQPRGILINNISRHYDNAYNMNERDSLIKKDGVLYLG
jgi:hypothetical protein